MIGNAREVATISWWYRHNLRPMDSFEMADNIPNGWRYLGAGRDKVAFLGPSGIVYKAGNLIPCEKETINIQNAKPLKGWHIPQAYLWTNKNFKKYEEEYAIISMEYIPGSSDLPNYRYYQVGDHFGLRDLFWDNIKMTHDGLYAVVDWSD